ncbi:MAG: SDR family oxidoreductase, partial [Syntrophomonadaceae bacterium]|nr:SDR family oxidoreductase [Syntrophomonadaceae bacterium]
MMEQFMRAGARVAVIDIAPGPIYCDYYYRGDLADEQVLEDFTSQVIERFGKIDFLINNAAVSLWGILSDLKYDEFMYVLRVGVVAPYMLTKLFLPHFDEGAAIVNISSTRSFMSQPDT